MQTNNDLEDQPIRIIVSKGRNITTQYLVDLAAECFAKINSLPDQTFEVVFNSSDTSPTFSRYSLFVSIIKNFGCDIKNNEF